MQAIAVEKLGEPLVRYGNWPKRGLIYRTDNPFRKIQTAEHWDEAKRKHQAEVIGDGEQFVAFPHSPGYRSALQVAGILPETYAVFELTTATEAKVREVVEDVTVLFRKRG